MISLSFEFEPGEDDKVHLASALAMFWLFPESGQLYTVLRLPGQPSSLKTRAAFKNPVRFFSSGAAYGAAPARKWL